MSKRTKTNAAVVLAGCVLLFSTGGCRFFGRASIFSGPQRPVRHVICIYQQKPWVSADAKGDRDPEGLRYRVFLDVGKKRGVLRDGTFNIEMYTVSRGKDGKKRRELVSDWHYPASTFAKIHAKILGEGYLLNLRWASKSIAGHDIEIVTSFEDPSGKITRATTKRLRVPKYDDFAGRVK